MATVALKPREAMKISVEGENISPDKFAGKNADAIKAIEAWQGNVRTTIGALFDVTCDGTGDAAGTKIVISGSVPRVKRIGEGMTAGEIEVRGDVDMHLGAKMTGGRIVVKGNADSWAGREMKGGEILIEGNAGFYVGAGYRGESCGMRGGKITVNGNVRDFLGEHMCGGEILVKGNAGLLPGISNNGGKIVIGGTTSLPGSEMKKGTIIVKGAVQELLPVFKPEGNEVVDGINFRKFTGDAVLKGAGLLYVKA